MAKQPKDDRRFTVEITAAELRLLVKAHTSYCRKVTNLVGREVMKIRATGKGKGTRDVQAVIDAGESLAKDHVDRAKELLALLQ